LYRYSVTSKKRCRIVDFNPWGGATLPLLFDWAELTQPPARPTTEVGLFSRGMQSTHSA
jgi:hypothetical protein